MRNFILGFIIGLILGSASVGFSAMPGNRTEREYDKFVECSGQTCVRIYITE